MFCSSLSMHKMSITLSIIKNNLLQRKLSDWDSILPCVNQLMKRILKFETLHSGFIAAILQAIKQKWYNKYGDWKKPKFKMSSFYLFLLVNFIWFFVRAMNWSRWSCVSRRWWRGRLADWSWIVHWSHFSLTLQFRFQLREYFAQCPQSCLMIVLENSN